jgi:AcrR family transcriptional regulator
MSRNTGETTKKNILYQSFILFSTKPYDKVTFPDIEKSTGLSRGAILYHFASKQDIFNAVVESSLINRSLFIDLPIKENNPLENFILDFIKSCSITIKEMSKSGIKNTNFAYYNIESQALYFYEQFDKLSRQMRVTEIKVWMQVIKKAQEKNEIKKTFDPQLLATLFLDTYYGHAFAATKEEKGCDLDFLLKELMLIREMSIK